MLRVLTVISALLFAFPAAAHIVASPDTAKSSAWFRTALRVSHGCEGSDTTNITVQIPADILIVKPQAKTGWKIFIKKEKLAQPVQGPHGMISEVTKSISWEGHLSDAYFDEFGLSMKLPETTGDLYLPVIQSCVKGKIEWKDKASGHHHSHDGFPAPVIHITK